jgi:hypothetical protein
MLGCEIVMIYGLSRYVIGSSAFVEISEEEYQKIKSAKVNSLEVLFIEEKFDVVIENYLELEISLLEITAGHMVLRNLSYAKFQNEINLVNRRLINILSSIRSYLDQTMHHLNNIFKKGSKTVKEIEEYKSHIYDQYVGYRVMEALRNYVQHKGFPIHSVIFNSKWVDSNSRDKMLFSLTPYIHPEKLEEDEKFKKVVLKELKFFGDKIDIKPLMRDYIAALGNIHEKFRYLLKADVHAWTQTILGAISRFQEAYPNESSIAGLEAVERNDDGTYKQRVPIFKDFIEYRQQLERKNSALSTLGKRYVSSEVIEPKPIK